MTRARARTHIHPRKVTHMALNMEEAAKGKKIEAGMGKGKDAPKPKTGDAHGKTGSSKMAPPWLKGKGKK